MGATDNSAVNITINVVDGATGETISRVTKSLDSLGEAGMRNGQRLKQGMQDVGHAGEGVGPAVGRGMKEAGAHSLNALDNVRLLRDDLGIRIPRAMEKVISQSRLAMGAIGAIGTGLVAIGAIEVGVRIGQQLYEMYKKFIDVNGQVDEFKKKLAEAAEQKFFDVASIEDVNAHLQTTTALMSTLEAQRRSSIGIGGLIGAGVKAFAKGGVDAVIGDVSSAMASRYYNSSDLKAEQGAIGDTDAGKARKAATDHAIQLQQIRDRRELAGASGAAAAQQAELNARIAEADETRRYSRVQLQQQYDIENRGKGIADKPNDPRYKRIAPDAGNDQYQRDVTSARIEYGAARTKQGIGERNEADHAKAEAGIAGLQGEPFYLAQEQEELRMLLVKKREVGMALDVYADLSQAIRTKANEERKKRIADENAQTAQLDAEAGLGGLTGLAKLDQERVVKLAALNREAPKFADPTTLAARTADINRQSASSQGKEQEGFTDRLKELDSGRADRYASESDRITQSAQKTVAEITRAWTEMYGQLAPLDARRVQSQMALNEEISKINADAARQRGEAGQRVEDETRKLEDQARRQSLPKYQQETAAIVDDYNERIQKLEELRSKDAANADRYRRQELAEEQIKNGKLLEQRRALEDALAGRLKGLIGSHPLDFLKSQGEDEAGKFASQALFKLAPNFSTALAGGGLKHGGTGPFGAPNIFGSGWGGKHPATFDAGASQAGSGTHNDNPLAATLGKPHADAGETVLTASTATINVGSATFTGAAGGGRASSGSYVPIGNGGYFNLGGAGTGGLAGGDAGLPGASSPIGAGGGAGSSAGGIYDEAGAAASVGGQVEAGVSTAQTVGADAKSIGDSLGIKKAGDLDDKMEAGLGSKLGGEAGAALGVFSAVEGKGGFGGALSGAVSGAKLGAEIGGPIGAAVGAIGGAALGLLGLGARSKAEKYNTRTVKPRVANDLIAYEAGQMDYQSAYDDMTHLITEAKIETRQMGSSALSYYNSTIDPEIKQAQARLTREQKAGRAEFGMSAAQFHRGGLIRDFGAMATSADEGWIHAQRNEIMLNQQAAMTHADAAMLMNSGASRSQMADYYGGGSGTRIAQSSGASEVHLHVHAIDTRGVKQFFDDNKHTLRDSLNASYADNSGGGDYA